MHEIGWFVTWTLDPLGQLLVFVVAVAVLARIDAALTLLVFVPLLVVFVLTNQARGRIKRYRQANQEAIGEVTGLLGELYGAALAVKVAGAERRVVEHLEGINERRPRAGVRDARADAVRRRHPAAHGQRRHGPAAPRRRGAMRDGRFSVGDFALFVAYLPWLAQAAELVRRVPGQAAPRGRLARAPAGVDAGRAAGAARPPRAPLPPPRAAATAGPAGPRARATASSGSKRAA